MTLAVGIAANTAIFSVVHGVILSPLPYPDPDRLVMVGHSALGLNLPELEQAFGTYFLYREYSEVFDDLAVAQEGSQTLTGEGEPERVRSARVSHSFFNVMRVAPALGRITSEGDDIRGAPLVVVLSHGLWTRRFGEDPGIIGSSIRIGSVPHEVIGVMPPGFRYPEENTDLWLPVRPAPDDFGGFYLIGIGRLKPDVTAAQASADLQRLIPMVPDHYPNWTAGLIEDSQLSAVVTPLKESMVGDVGRTLWILLGAVGIVLLVACANVANLFFVRAEGRHRETAVRAALGAGRIALVRSYMTEIATLAFLGGLSGLLLAWLGIHVLIGLVPQGLPRIDQIGINGPVLAFTAAISVFSGLFFGFLPLLRFTVPDIAAILREGGRGTSVGRKRIQIRHSLVVAQIALALVLLVGSGLMARSFQRLRNVDPGFDPTNVLTFMVALPGAEYPSWFDAVRFHEEITGRIEALPGVRAVGSARGVPLTGNGYGRDPLLSEDRPVRQDEIPPIVYMNPVNPGFFRTMGIPLLSGRELEYSDSHERTGAVVVSSSLANRYWPDENPIGKRVYPGLNVDPLWYTVVGVVGDVHVNSLRHESLEIIYLPTIGTNDAFSWSPLSMEYAVRTDVPPLSLVGAIRDAIWAVNPRLPIARMRTMEQIVADSTMQTAFAMLLIGIAAVVALVLGTVGIYGVIAFVVGQRTGEIGIRMALGARSQQVGRMVLKQGAFVALFGVGIGLVGAFGLTRLLGGMLFDISPTDPSTYAAVSVLLFVVALFASYLPARRAATVDPVEALRAE